MNWLSKINLNVVTERMGPFKSAILLFSLIITCLYCGYRIGNFYHTFQVQKIQDQQFRLDSLYLQQAGQVRRINTLEVELEVEKLANERAMSILKEMEVSHSAVKKELAFYEKVMAPEKKANGLVIDDFVITKTESKNHYRFQAVLVQQQTQKRYAKGYVDFVVNGSQAGKPASLKLSDISSLDRKAMGFSFQYFKVIEGEITLPEDFVAEEVDVSVVLPKGKWQKYQRLDNAYPWPKQTP